MSEPGKSNNNNSKTHIKLVDGLSHIEILNLAFSNAVKHVVHRQQVETTRELRASLIMHHKPESFLNFPLATSLRPSHVNAETEKVVTIFERPFAKLEDKEITLTEIAAVFEEARLNTSLKDDVLLAADELICNALFNAPQPDGRNLDPLAKTLKNARTAPLRQGTLKIGAFNGFLALCCEDRYGSLKPLRMLERVHKCLMQGPGEAMNVSDAGTAGIGSFMVFSACTSLFMCVKEGEKSVVCVLFPLTVSARARAMKPKNIHWNQF